MTNPLHDYLCQQLDEMLRNRGVVVFYDPRREFEPFFDEELEDDGTGDGGLRRVLIKARSTFVVRHTGSFLRLRHEVEPIAELDTPDRVIIYVPGVERDRKKSVLMELEKGGRTYEPQLKRLARNVLRQQFTEGRIDDLLRPTRVSYRDIAVLLKQGSEGISVSILHTVFGHAKGERLIARWIAEDEKDAEIAEKEAREELFKLVECRLGLPMAPDDPLASARGNVLRYVLVNEFRSDLACAPPHAVAMVPEPPSKEHVSRTREVAETLRRNHATGYVELAEKVEGDLGLATVEIDAGSLGKIDTFRFEERALLAHAGELICDGRYEDAHEIVRERRRSFWVDRDVNRQAQWEACRMMAVLGEAINKVGPMLGKANGNPARWVQAYAGEMGWFRVDSLQRSLDTWVAKMDHEPETHQALSVVRRAHEELLKKMAEGFSKVFVEAGWTISGVLHQTGIYPDVVKTMGGRVGYFLVDAMRFEMGEELANQLGVGLPLSRHAARL